MRVTTGRHAARQRRENGQTRTAGGSEHKRSAGSGMPDASPSPTRPPAPAPSAVGRFVMGFVYAGRGLVYALRTQRNVRVHTALALAAIALSIALRLSAVEFALVFVAITGVFIAEMFNTVIEACVDLITEEYRPLARVAKDVAAGAVLLSAILAVVIALFVYMPHLWPLLVRWLGK